MSVKSNLHILATSAGLGDDEVAALWTAAQDHAISNTGSESHPKFRDQAEKRMVRLIEDKATENVPPQLIPWVLFDIHMGLAIVSVRNGIKNARVNTLEYFADLRGKRAA